MNRFASAALASFSAASTALLIFSLALMARLMERVVLFPSDS